MKRQLYEGGGISTLQQARDILEAEALPGESLAYINPQEAAMLKYMGGAGIPINSSGVPSYFVKSIAKAAKSAVKGVAKGVKSIVKSDIGKLALLAAGAYYAPALFGGTVGFGPASTYGNFAKGLMSPNLIGPMTKAGSLGRTISSALTGGGALSSLIPGKGSLIAGGVGLAVGMLSPQQIQTGMKQDPGGVRSYLRQYYLNLNPEATEEEAENFAVEQTREYAANGGRIGFEEGGTFLTMEEAAERDPAMFMDTTTYNPIPENAPNMAADEIAKVIMGTGFLPEEDDELGYSEGMEKPMDSKKFIFEKYVIPKRKELMENFGLSLEEANDLITEGMDKYRSKKADGGMPTGIMRTNQAGVKERDYREDGGFVPVGIKEKADDVPAMLSKNEFVFTADAVRGAGNGDVEKGAERLYNTMKTLENGGTV